MNDQVINIQDRVQSLARDFMTIINAEIKQIDGESETEKLRNQLMFLDLIKDDFNRIVANKKNELLQVHGTKKE